LEPVPATTNMSGLLYILALSTVQFLCRTRKNLNQFLLDNGVLCAVCSLVYNRHLSLTNKQVCMYMYSAGNLSPNMGARNQVGIGLSYWPASLCSLATQFQTRFLESIPRPIAGLKIPIQGPKTCKEHRNRFQGIDSSSL
jgi:hypothetical protein